MIKAIRPEALLNPHSDGCLIYGICNLINFIENKQKLNYQDAEDFYNYLKTNNSDLLKKYMPSFDPGHFFIGASADGICLAFNNWYGRKVLETKRLDVKYFPSFMSKNKALICSVFLEKELFFHAILLCSAYTEENIQCFSVTDSRYPLWNNFTTTGEFLLDAAYPLKNYLKEVIIYYKGNDHD